jgi:hypothetical protein
MPGFAEQHRFAVAVFVCQMRRTKTGALAMSKELLAGWQNPPSGFRSAPFWSWNSNLVPQRLTEEIEQMSKAGMGGFFMHSRYGLKTPYLGEEWFKCIQACVDKAKALGMKAYLYDEDRWPSGPAGGLVTKGHKEYRTHILVAAKHGGAGPDAERVAMFAIRVDPDGNMISYRQAQEGEPLENGEQLVSFDLKTAETTPWHNDGAYLDTMNPDAVAEFIRVTHRAYADRFGKYFGDIIPAIFTDEPNYGWRSTTHGFFQRKSDNQQDAQVFFPWTPQLPREFTKRCGYDLLEHLPELLSAKHGAPFSKVRYDYSRVTTELFVENYSGQIGKWCGRHKINSTGHVLCEDDLESQMRCVGAAMPHYQHMQWPGIDILTDAAVELLTAKQCSSVADQLGKERVLSELYGCTGWDWPLEGHKFGGDWQFASGVNFRCPHLTHYSLAGGAKRDYPASIFVHSPWWKYYKAVEDYFGRLSYMLTQGKPVRDVLVIHPIETAWGVYLNDKSRTEESPVRPFTNGVYEVGYALSYGHFDWNFGDESLIAKYGKINANGVAVGKMTYKVVVVPPSLTLRSTTVALLKRFQAAGGKVIFVGTKPTHIDAKETADLVSLLEKATSVNDAPGLLADLEAALPRRVSIEHNGAQAKAWYMLRAVTGGQLLFIQSHDRHNACEVHVSAQGGRPVVLWDPLTGTKTRVKADVAGDHVEFNLPLPASGSALVSMGLSVSDALKTPATQTIAAAKTIAGPFDVELTEPNTMPLDYCCYRFGDDPFSGAVPVLKADIEIRKRFGLLPRMGGEHQPWYLYAMGAVDLKPRGPVQLKWNFHVTDKPGKLCLALEGPQNFKVAVNGKDAPPPAGHWVDQDIKTIDIASLVQAGENEILLSCQYRPDIEIEDMYLVGDFGVASRNAGASTAGLRKPGNMTLVAPVKRLSEGSWVGQGLDFYGGSVNYKIKVDAPPAGQSVRITIPDVPLDFAGLPIANPYGPSSNPAAFCTAAAIHVNGKTFPMPWAPFAADITDALHPGANEVTVEIIGGRKNIMGPLHVPWQKWTGPGEFNPANPKWTDDYLLWNHGLLGPLQLEYLS